MPVKKCVPDVHERVQYLVSRAYVLRKYHTQIKKGESRSRDPGNDLVWFYMHALQRPRPLPPDAGHTIDLVEKFFLSLTMSWDLIR